MIDDFLHMSITCRDLETTIRFYEALGLRTIMRLGLVDDPGIAEAFRLAEGKLKVAYLATSTQPGAMFIDLVEWVVPTAVGTAYPSLDNVGLNRFALRVTGLDAVVTNAREQGIMFLTDAPVSVGYKSMRFIVARDPDGVFVQLVENF